MAEDSDPIGIRDRLVDVGSRVLVASALAMPYRVRVPFVGWVTSRVIAPLAGWRRRIRDNLALVLPDLPRSEVERIVRNVPDNVGRTLIEIYSGRDFVDRVMDSPLEGPGLGALEAAKDAGRPIVLVTAHIGNYDAARGKLSRTGYPMAALYRPMKNAAFNAHYLRAISGIAEPLFATDVRGIAGFVRHLRDKGIVAIVADVGSRKAPLLEFMGKPAHTPLSAAEWAVKYGADFIPIFALRQRDGLTFRIHVAEPVPHGAPQEMMQRYNDTLEQIVLAYPDQWFWIHRRWKRGRTTT